jgi:hypothetical protein
VSITSGTVGASEIVIEARVIRADGTVEELGRIAYWHRNPFKRLAWRLRRMFGNQRKGNPHDR